MCPLCGFEDVQVIRTIQTAQITAIFRKRYDIDTSRYFADSPTVELLHCRQCGLARYEPAPVGGNELYERLATFDWYYGNRREHADARKRLLPGSVLEVGCGNGLFGDGLDDYLGIDLNDAAVERGKAKGRKLECRLLESIDDEFDNVCAFQALEHVPDPKEFVEQLAARVRPGGRLLLSTPNGESFAAHDEKNVLNMPPHHLTVWNRSAFRYLQRCNPLKLIDVVAEPLSEEHGWWYFDFHKPRFFDSKAFRALKLHKLSIAVIRLLCNFIKGHSILVVYEKHG